MAVRLIEGARRRALAGCLACAAGILLVAFLSFRAPAFERLDEDLLNAISTPSGSILHDLAFAVEQLLDPIGWAAAATGAFLLASWRGRYKLALFAVALVVGTGLLDLILKAVFEHHREQSIPVGEFEWFPVANAYPSGHAAGALAISLAYLFVVPSRWRRATAAAGLAFTLAISLGLLVLNYHYPGDILGGWLVALGWCFALLAVDADREGSASEPEG
jgi:membrane-associated phospholipid phosphatase